MGTTRRKLWLEKYEKLLRDIRLEKKHKSKERCRCSGNVSDLMFREVLQGSNGSITRKSYKLISTFNAGVQDLSSSPARVTIFKPSFIRQVTLVGVAFSWKRTKKDKKKKKQKKFHPTPPTCQCVPRIDNAHALSMRLPVGTSNLPLKPVYIPFAKR